MSQKEKSVAVVVVVVHIDTASTYNNKVTTITGRPVMMMNKYSVAGVAIAAPAAIGITANDKIIKTMRSNNHKVMTLVDQFVVPPTMRMRLRYLLF